MQSYCPTCLDQIEHEQGQGSVTCPNCDTTFDPSQQGDDLPPIDPSQVIAAKQKKAQAPADAGGSSGALDTVTAPVAEPEPEPEPGPMEGPDSAASDPFGGDFGALTESGDGAGEPDVGDLSSHPELGATPEPGEAFSEASQVFEELREFGESVIPGQPEPPSESTPAEGAQPAPAARSASAAPAGMRMTSGATLQGFVIEEYHPPVSLGHLLDPDAEEPLKSALLKLWERATACGANAVVDLKWSITGDNTRVMISGTPVRCKKG